MRVKTKPIESREEKTKAITKPKTREERAHALYITVQTIQSKIWDDWAENVFRVSCQKLHQLMNWRPTPWSSGGTLNEKNEIYFQQALWLTWPWRILIMAPVVSQDHHTLFLSFFFTVGWAEVTLTFAGLCPLTESHFLTISVTVVVVGKM